MSVISDCLEERRRHCPVSKCRWLLARDCSILSTHWAARYTVSEARESGAYRTQANVILKWLHANKFISIYFDLIIFLNVSFTVLQPQRWKRQCRWVISVRNNITNYKDAYNKVMRVGYNCILVQLHSTMTVSLHRKMHNMAIKQRGWVILLVP